MLLELKNNWKTTNYFVCFGIVRASMCVKLNTDEIIIIDIIKKYDDGKQLCLILTVQYVVL